MLMPGDYSGNFPVEYQQYNTQYAGRLETIGWQWYDTQTYVSGTTTSLTQWWNTRATPDLSNMQIPYQFAAPQAYLLRAIRFFVKQRAKATSPTTTGNQTCAFDNIAQLINTGVFNLTIGNKNYGIVPMWVLTAGGGAFGAMAATGQFAGASLYDYAQNGVPDPRAVQTLSKPLFIPPQMNFTATVTWPTALTLAGGSNVDICLLMDGDLLRPVQ